MTRGSSVAILLAASLCILAGCAARGEPAPQGGADITKVRTPLREPVWVTGKDVLLAMEEDKPRVVSLDPASGKQLASQTFGSTGENVVANPDKPDRSYLPLSDSGRIAVLDTGSLRTVRSFEVGIPPSYASFAVQAETLFALSEDGSKVAGENLKTSRSIHATDVKGSRDTVMEAPEKGLDPAFWTASPDGVAFYGGSTPKRLVGLPLAAKDIAVDLESSQRAYVFAPGSSVVVAVEGDPARLLGGRLLVDKKKDVGAEIQRITCDETSVYVATRNRLVVLDREKLEPVETADFEHLLKRKDVGGTGISGITIGDENVYLTVAGEPYFLTLEKP